MNHPEFLGNESEYKSCLKEEELEGGYNFSFKKMGKTL
jgi:hypothetical protein